MALKLDLSKFNKEQPSELQKEIKSNKRICNEVIKYSYMTEVTIYPDGKSFVRSWAVGEAKEINQNKKASKVKEKVSTFKETQTEFEEL